MLLAEMTVRLLDTERTCQTPEQASYTYRVAGPMARALAYVLDSLMVSVVILLLSVAFMFIGLEVKAWAMSELRPT